MSTNKKLHQQKWTEKRREQMRAGTFGLYRKPRGDGDWQMRTCLKCDREFMSQGKSNRICPRCAMDNYYHSLNYTEEAIQFWGRVEL